MNNNDNQQINAQGTNINQYDTNNQTNVELVYKDNIDNKKKLTIIIVIIIIAFGGYLLYRTMNGSNTINKITSKYKKEDIYINNFGDDSKIDYKDVDKTHMIDVYSDSKFWNKIYTTYTDPRYFDISTITTGNIQNVIFLKNADQTNKLNVSVQQISLFDTSEPHYKYNEFIESTKNTRSDIKVKSNYTDIKEKNFNGKIFKYFVGYIHIQAGNISELKYTILMESKISDGEYYQIVYTGEKQVTLEMLKGYLSFEVEDRVFID